MNYTSPPQSISPPSSKISRFSLLIRSKGSDRASVRDEPAVFLDRRCFLILALEPPFFVSLRSLGQVLLFFFEVLTFPFRSKFDPCLFFFSIVASALVRVMRFLAAMFENGMNPCVWVLLAWLIIYRGGAGLHQSTRFGTFSSRKPPRSGINPRYQQDLLGSVCAPDES